MKNIESLKTKLRKMEMLEKTFYGSTILFGLSFLVFVNTKLGETSHGISGFGFLLFSLTMICSYLLIWDMSRNKKNSSIENITKRMSLEEFLVICDTNENNYYECLRSNDKSRAVELGKVFYRYYSCQTIFQQNNILLQIQTDILSHTK
jgi:hypothetical protein